MIKNAKMFLILAVILLIACFVFVSVMSLEMDESILNPTFTPVPTSSNIKPTPKPIVIEEGVTITASKEPGFYKSGFLLELYCSNEEYRILYTITSHEAFECDENTKVAKTGEECVYSGGVLPDIENLDQGSYFYKEPIPIPGKPYSAKDPVRITIIRAVAVNEKNEWVTDVYTFTYIIGERSLYGIYLVSICIDEECLYGYEKGIFIKGKTFDDERKMNPEKIIDTHFPRNYLQKGIEWEREAHIQIFDIMGNLVVDQKVGLRINGGASRHYSVKSLKIYARKKYGKGKIEFEIFEGLEDNYGRSIEEFDKLIFRNSGNDFTGIMFKDVFLHRLAREMGLDWQEGTPCTVYINGKYYSLMNIRESMDGEYIESRYGVASEFVDMVGINYESRGFIYTTSYGLENAAIKFEEDMSMLVNTDWSVHDISEMEEVIDVNNFIEYMAYQIYIRNTDWPHNNVLAWRYRGIPSKNLEGRDGKWRFLIKDMDYRNVFVDYFDNTLRDVLGNRMTKGPCLGEVLMSCLDNQEFRERFLSYLLGLCNRITPDLVDALLLEMKEEWRTDIEIFWKYHGGGESEWLWRIEQLKTFARLRADYIRVFVDELIESLE